VKTVLSLALFASLAGAASAEPLSAAQQQVALAKAAPDLSPKTGLAGSGVVLTADSDGSEAAIAFGRSWDGARGIDFNTWGVKITAPLDKKTKSSSFLTDDGFAKGGALTVSYSSVRGREFALPATPARRRELLALGRVRCERDAPRERRPACAAATFSEVSEYLSEAERAEMTDQFLTAPIWLYGVSGSIGRANYGYRDAASFSEKSAERTPYSVALSVGYSPDSRPIYFGGGLEYKVDYKAAKERTLCPQPAAGGVIECFTAPFASPKRDISSSVFGVTRFQWLLGSSPETALPVALEFKGAYDTKGKEFGAGAALYLFSDGKQNLRGGVRASWSGETGDVRAGIFVGSAFSLF
jgi:hypothetical protein